MKKERIKRLLPSVFQNTAKPGNPLFAILEVMETMHAPCESTLDRLHENFNPNRASDAFVPYLASWVDLEVLFDVPRAKSPSSSLALPLLRHCRNGAGPARESASFLRLPQAQRDLKWTSRYSEPMGKLNLFIFVLPCRENLLSTVP